jgi:gliding motility-associated-like protein
MYSLNGGIAQSSGLFSGLSSGSFLLHIEDQLGCYLDSTIIIAMSPPIQLNSILVNPAQCFGTNTGSLSVNAVGGIGALMYGLNSGAVSVNPVFSGLFHTTFTVNVTDSLSCMKDSVVQIGSPPPLQFTSILMEQPYCTSATNGKITIYVNGGVPPYQYAINTSLYTTNNIFPNLYQGTYTIHVRDYNNCEHDTVVQLSAADYMFFQSPVVQHVSCKYGNDGSIALTASGGVSPYQYTINSVSVGTIGNFSNLGVGIYTIIVADQIGCEKDTVIQITEPLLPLKAEMLNITPNICRGDSNGSITAGAGGGTSPYMYSMDGINYQTSSSFNGLMAGMYMIYVKDNNDCLTDTIALVTEPDTSVQLFLLGIKDISCVNVDDGTIQVTSRYGSLPVSYTLNGAAVGVDTFYAGLPPGNYIVEVKDQLGCKSTGKFVVQPSDLRPFIRIDSIGTVLCAGDDDGYVDWHAINTYPPYYYTFDSVFIGTKSDASGLTNATYFIQVTDSRGCYADTTITLEEVNKIDLSVSATPAICSGLGDDGKAVAVVSGGQSPFTYRWSGSIGNYTDEADQLLFGQHTAYVQDALGCVDSTAFEIEFDPCCLVNLPNAFSPNGDGVNDHFKTIQYGHIDIVSLEIFNRWGNKVYSTSAEGIGWDGKYLGTDCDVGTYFYLLRYRCYMKNELVMLKGDITLLR